jgi:hypothetical protein
MGRDGTIGGRTCKRVICPVSPACLNVEEIKRALVQKMVEWGLVPIENVPPEPLAPIDGTVDDGN